MACSPVIELHGITKTYKTGEVLVHALVNVDLAIDTGEMVAIMGPSGSGKSTLMNVLGCLDRPTSGSYRFEGRRGRTPRGRYWHHEHHALRFESRSEREKVGIRLAIGASVNRVLLQFLIEAVVLSAAGGLIGIALGIKEGRSRSRRAWAGHSSSRRRGYSLRSESPWQSALSSVSTPSARRRG